MTDPIRPIAPTRGESVVDASGRMSLPLANFLEQLQSNVNPSLTLSGAGAPEGSVNAPRLALYIDENGTASTVQYRKLSDDIAGDTTKGWVLV